MRARAAQGQTQGLWGQMTWGCRVLLCSLQLGDLGQVTPPLWASASLCANDSASSTHACGLARVKRDNPGNMPGVMANGSPRDLRLLPPPTTRPAPRDLRLSTAVLSTARGDPQAPEGPGPAAPPRRAGGLRRPPGSRARGGLAAGPPSGPAASAPGRTPGFRAAHPRQPAPGPGGRPPARCPSIPHPERPTHRLLHGGRHLGTGLRRAAGRAARARSGPGPSLAPCGLRPPRKYNTGSIFLPAASSTRGS